MADLRTIDPRLLNQQVGSAYSNSQTPDLNFNQATQNVQLPGVLGLLSSLASKVDSVGLQQNVAPANGLVNAQDWNPVNQIPTDWKSAALMALPLVGGATLNSLAKKLPLARQAGKVGQEAFHTQPPEVSLPSSKDLFKQVGDNQVYQHIENPNIKIFDYGDGGVDVQDASGFITNHPDLASAFDEAAFANGGKFIGSKGKVIDVPGVNHNVFTFKGGLTSEEKAEQLLNQYNDWGYTPKRAFNALKSHFDYPIESAYANNPEYKYTRTPNRPIESYLSDRKQAQPIIKPSENTLNALINSRDSYYHTTDPAGFEGIVRSGQINVGGGDRFRGVSVSRASAIDPKSKPVTLVLDRKMFPKSQPTVDFGYGPDPAGFTTGYSSDETEVRTLNKPVPTSAIKGIIVNKSKLYDPQNTTPTTRVDPHGWVKEHMENIHNLAETLGVPVKVIEHTGALKHYRATFSKLPPGSPLFTLPPIGVAAGLQYVKNYTTPTPSQGGRDKLKEQ